MRTRELAYNNDLAIFFCRAASFGNISGGQFGEEFDLLPATRTNASPVAHALGITPVKDKARRRHVWHGRKLQGQGRQGPTHSRNRSDLIDSCR